MIRGCSRYVRFEQGPETDGTAAPRPQLPGCRYVGAAAIRRNDATDLPARWNRRAAFHVSSKGQAIMEGDIAGHTRDGSLAAIPPLVGFADRAESKARRTRAGRLRSEG